MVHAEPVSQSPGIAPPRQAPAGTGNRRQAQHRLLVGALLLCDLLALASGFAVAFAIRYYAGLSFFVDVEPTLDMHVRSTALILPLWILLFALFGLYQERNLLGGTREYALVFNASTAGTMLAVAATFFSQRLIISRGWLVLAWLLGFGAASAFRFGLRRIIYRLRRRGHLLAPAVIVGAGGEGQALALQLRNWPTSGLRLLGFVDDTLPPGTPVCEGLQVLGRVSDVPALAGRLGVEEVIVASSSIPREALIELARHYALSDRMQIRLSSGLFEVLTTGVQVKEMGSVHLICLDKVRLSPAEMVLKTLLDYLVAVPSLLALSPVLLAIAVAIRLDSPGPPLHSRMVLGRRGRSFRALKFRTMHTDGEAILEMHPVLREELARNGKLKHDPRVTRLGRHLRRWSLDELPQLLNVLLRQMSMVGPRMISPDELEKYGKWDMNLLTVWPGITGPWQTSGRSEVGYQERVQMDMEYIRNYTIWLDLQILLQTAPAVLRGRGAY